jgi:hypothetical protein
MAGWKESQTFLESSQVSGRTCHGGLQILDE